MSSAMNDRLSRVVADASIMMIDDEPLNMEVLQIHLESAGYSKFVSISDSRMALKEIESHMPDVLLLDIVMPHVSGLDILEEMQRRPTLAGIPVIVLTSEDDSRVKLRALELGASDFLAKPLDPSELALRMRNNLEARSWHLRDKRLDTLTELPNKECIGSLLTRQYTYLESQDTSSVVALIDLNRFKAINQSHGTAVGDAVLWEVRERLLANFGRNDPRTVETLSLCDDHTTCVARLGADRFMVLMTGLAPETMLTEVASRISRFLGMLSEPIMLNSSRVFVSASIGVARIGHDGHNVVELLSAAETAMGSARDAGVNRYAFYASDMDESVRERLLLDNGLRTAIDDNELFLVYQPKVEVKSGRITGVEALVRWTHPTQGLVSPVDFIDLAEENGTIVPIGKWVLQEACEQAKAWHVQGYKDLQIAVNVSIRQLSEPDFVSELNEIVSECGIDPSCLIVELTENMIMENAEANIVKLQSIRDIGVRLSIDDFGTGYSSLAYLQRFSMDQVKIDQSFIKEIVDQNSPSPIVNAIVSLAHDLGLDVVAEGVETRAQLERLISIGCDQFQGYLVSPPVVAPDFEKLLAMASGSGSKAA